MRVAIHIYEFGAVVPKYIGYIDYPKEEFNVLDAEECFSICNWSLWSDEKPEILHSDIQSCSHGICFTAGYLGVKWLAKSFGWLSGNLIEISEYVKQNKDNIIWD